MPNGMRCLDPSIADRITSLSTMRNNEEIFETFGFSYNTLRKVSNGMPLRRSLADRIEERARKVFEADGFLNISARSEEHTSELQSLMLNSYAVFCLNKKQTKIKYTLTTTEHINNHTTGRQDRL